MAGQRIASNTGVPIPQQVLATPALGLGPSLIELYDRQYSTLVQTDLAEGDLLGPASAAAATVPLAMALPEGASIKSAGDAEVMAAIFFSFALAIGAGTLLVEFAIEGIRNGLHRDHAIMESGHKRARRIIMTFMP